MLKLCFACNTSKPLTEFSFKNKNKKLYSAECKSCHKQYNAKWYQENRDKVTKRVRQNNRLYRERAYKLTSELKNVPCADCKQTFHPIAMDFDHLDPSAKEDCVSHLVRLGKPLDIILAEAKKCEVVCAVCHRLRTLKRFKQEQ